MSYVNYNVRQFPFVIRYVADLVRFRHLCWNLAGSDLRSRFRRSRLGILWATIQPLTFSLMIAFVWGSIFQAEDYWSFAAYVFSGMLVWEYFSTTTLGALDALSNSSGYLRQQRIPFLIFQLRGPIVSSVIFIAGFVGLVILLTAIGELPPLGLHLLLVPATLGIAFMFMLPMSILMSVAGTQYRDLRYITTLLLQAMFFLTPVMLKRDFLEKPPLDLLNFINPAVPLFNLFRAPILYGEYWNVRDLLVILCWIAGMWVAAIAVSVIFGRRVVFAL